MPFSVSTPPGVEPVSLAELKAHLRVDGSAEDDLITSQGKAAREWVEAVTGKQFVEATLVDVYDGFPCAGRPILLSRSPVTAISGIIYTDTAGDPQSWTGYQSDLVGEPARIFPAYGEVYPSARGGDVNSVSVTYTAGYSSDASDVPDSIKAAIKLLVGHWYEHRMAATPENLSAAPLAVQHLIAPYRVRRFS